MVTAIEAYNKPRNEYRDETFSILLLNAWELLLKAILSKNHESIFYRKERRQPYRTLSLRDAYEAAKRHFPTDIDPIPVKRNLELITTYRDNAVHFYNESGLSALLWALAQTSILNYRDLMFGVFGVDLARDVNWRILPLGARQPIDPIQYLTTTAEGAQKARPAVRQYVTEILTAARELKDGKVDTGRFLTVFNVKLESVKKIGEADVVVGVVKAGDSSGPLVVEKTVDPNISHPLRQKDVLSRIPALHGVPFTAHTFQAIVWKYGLKEKRSYCWRATEGVLTKYSNDVIPFIDRLTDADVKAALTDYAARRSAKAIPAPVPAIATNPSV
ncbi:hypothetical protein B1B_01109 [mine drainage metagenome]|uniref:Uncharacterized protein n=1 Tax=mine drainage metagenome TaxID=410659 RepID=T1BWL8_9ZZZZ